MYPSILNENQRKGALAAGIAIIAMTIAATIANDVTIGKLVVERNETVTLKNILASKTTFNTGILCWLIILVSDVVAAWGLYIFFKPVSKNQSLIAAWFRLIYAAMLAVAIFNLVNVHILIQQAVPSAADLTIQLSREVMFYLDAFDTTFSFSLIVFGIHILLVGILVLKSGYVPKIFGIILITAFAGYTIINMSNILFPEYKDAMKIVEWIFLFPMLGEVALGIWLLIKGLRKKGTSEQNE
jgi:hypothetical protein